MADTKKKKGKKIVKPNPSGYLTPKKTQTDRLDQAFSHLKPKKKKPTNKK